MFFDVTDMKIIIKSTNHMEAVLINKGPISEIDLFHLQSSSEAVISRVKNIYEKPVSNLFKVSEYIVDVNYF